MPHDFTNDPRSPQPEPEGLGDRPKSIEEEYPTIGRQKPMERRAVGSWLDTLDEHMDTLVKRQIVDATKGPTERDRRGSFNALVSARHKHEQVKMQRQRMDLVLFHSETSENDGTVEGEVITPELVAAQVVAMQARIASPAPDDS